MEQKRERSNPRIGMAVALVFALLALLGFFMYSGPTRDATLHVYVTPSGAKVRLVEPGVVEGALDEQVASTGRVTFDKLPRGVPARVLVRAKDWKDGVGQTTLPEEGGEVTLKVDLQKESGSLAVTTEPQNAQVYIDGRAVGLSPHIESSIPAGRYSVTARLNGYKLAKKQVDIGPSGTTEVHLVLEEMAAEALADAGVIVEDEPPPQGYGRVILKSSHNSTFFVDNQVAGTGIKMRRNVLAGPHLIGCRALKRGSDTRRIEVIEGETMVVEFTFDEDPVERAKKATDPSTPLYWVVNGGSTRNSGRYGDAVEMFEKALEIDETYYPAHRQLGYTLPPLKRWGDAIEHLERYMELNPHAADKEFAEEMIGVYEQYRVAQEEGKPEPKIKWKGVGSRRDDKDYKDNRREQDKNR